MFEQQIEKGMVLLDEYEPGWDQLIDLERLEMEEGIFQPTLIKSDWLGKCGCVLAQTDTVRSNYDRGDYYLHAARLFKLVHGREPDTIDERDAWASDYGFMVEPDKRFYDTDTRDILTDEWKAAIQARRS